MLESVRKVVVAVPRIPARALLAVTTVGSFAWLLGQDLINPLVIYLLQLYLAF
jgi:hypothetical protein